MSEVKNSFDRLINRLDTSKQRISEFEDGSIEIIQTETPRDKSEN